MGRISRPTLTSCAMLVYSFRRSCGSSVRTSCVDLQRLRVSEPRVPDRLPISEEHLQPLAEQRSLFATRDRGISWPTRTRFHLSAQIFRKPRSERGRLRRRAGSVPGSQRARSLATSPYTLTGRTEDDVESVPGPAGDFQIGKSQLLQPDRSVLQ